MDNREKTLYGIIAVALVLAIGGFLFNIMAWFAIPAVVIIALALLAGWLRRKPPGEPGPPE